MTVIITSLTYSESKYRLNVTWNDSKSIGNYWVIVGYTLKDGEHRSIRKEDFNSSSMSINMKLEVPDWEELFPSIESIECSVNDSRSYKMERVKQPSNPSLRSDGSNITVSWDDVKDSNKYRVTLKVNKKQVTKSAMKALCVIPTSSVLLPSDVPKKINIAVSIVALSEDSTLLPSFATAISGQVQEPLMQYIGRAFDSSCYSKLKKYYFNDGTKYKNLSIVKISKLVIGHHADQHFGSETFSSIQATYLLEDGTTYEAPTRGTQKSGDKTTVIECGQLALTGRRLLSELSNPGFDQKLSMLISCTQGEDSAHFNTYGAFGVTCYPPSQGDLLTHSGNIVSLDGSYDDEHIICIGFYYSTPLISTTRYSLLPLNGGMRCFDDNIVRRSVVSIKRIDIQYTSYIVSIQATYVLQDGTTLQAPMHSGKKEGEAEQVSLLLEDGERVIQAFGSLKDHNDRGHLELETMLRDGTIKKYGPFGQENHYCFMARGNILGFKGIEGSRLNCGFYYSLDCSELYGGTGGRPFDDKNAFTREESTLFANSATGFIARVFLDVDGASLTGMSARYYVFYDSLEMDGGGGGFHGKQETLDVSNPHEHIVGITGKYGSGRVTQLAFKVRRENGNIENWGPFGSSSDADEDFEIKGIIVGFFGRVDDTYLYSIGAYYVPY